MPGRARKDARRPLRVVIADDHPLVLFALRRVLEREDDIELAGEAESGPQLLAIIARRRPDVALIDLNMPSFDGPATIARLGAEHPDVKVVVLSASDDRPSIDAVLAAGACAYVVKSLAWSEIPNVLRQTSSGAIFHAPSAAPRGPLTVEPPAGPCLTEREAMILRAIADGLTTSAISKQLWVSEHTVKFHLTNLYRKLGVTNRSGAVRYAYEQRLTSLAS